MSASPRRTNGWSSTRRRGILGNCWQSCFLIAMGESLRRGRCWRPAAIPQVCGFCIGSRSLAAVWTLREGPGCVTRVPWPGAASTWRRPPISSKRSRMLNSPNPEASDFSCVGSDREKSGASVGNRQADFFVGRQRQPDLGATRLGVLDHVEQQFAGRLEEQNANFLALRLRLGIDVDLDFQAACLFHVSAKPFDGHHQAGFVKDGWAELDSQRPRFGDALAQHGVDLIDRFGAEGSCANRRDAACPDSAVPRRAVVAGDREGSGPAGGVRGVRSASVRRPTLAIGRRGAWPRPSVRPPVVRASR